MPEGPEVRRVTDKLRNRLKGKWLLSASWMPNTKYSPMFDQNLDDASCKFPTLCLELICLGKQIFFFFENNIAFISGLGMEGHWFIFDHDNHPKHNSTEQDTRNWSYTDLYSDITKIPTKWSYFCLCFGQIIDMGQVRLALTEKDLWYDDMFKYGNFTITDWSGAFAKIETLGPDLLSTTHKWTDIKIQLPPKFYEHVTLDKFKSQIQNKRRIKMEICRFLMEPKYFVGIGNYLKCEILYRSRIHPHRTLGSLSTSEIQNLFSASIDIIASAYSHGGLTHGTFLDPDMEKGRFPVVVYKKKGQYDSNGYMIERIKTKDGRSTYYVSELQQL